MPSHLSVPLPSPTLINDTFQLPERTKVHCDGLRVIVVDDNSVYLSIVTRMLAKYFPNEVKYTYATSSPLCALEWLSLYSYDLILLDIDMPILTGIETTLEIRNPYSRFQILHSNRTIPIIAVTTNALDEHRRYYTEIGMNACVAKPVTLTELRRVLSRVTGISTISQ
ncbi:sensitivity to red-light reduced protein [Basidiobolus ranarum]|uniref:Sensitivity to red-light reduced protein n=1 Tax=Basidiobolus ranarum TaxID=34480 RepID=A0ABR2W889_9FUNG